MGRQLSCAVLVAFAIGCGNPSRAPIDSNDGSIVVPDGPQVPGEFGADCTEHTDCNSGYCVEPVGAHGGVCSRTCNDDCPQDWECHDVHLPEADVKLCVPAAQQLCLACANDTECGGGACLNIDGGGRCAIPCSGQCPTGYTCKADASGSHQGNYCQPITDSCTCTPAMAGAMRTCSEQADVNGTPATCFGSQTCSATTGWSACTAHVPAAETCNGVDDDCDFVVDDGVGGGTSCPITNGFGTCTGVQQCTGSSGFTCVGQTPAAEMCDAIDNNCNGAVDETFVAMGLGNACTAGTGACIRYGSQRCNSTQNGLTCSAVPGTPTAELCNQVDDNCDGAVDEPFKTGSAALGTVCTAGLGVCARGGTYVCATNGSSTTCSATANTGAMTTETCNYLDDNCDGVVDNGYRNASTGFYDTDTNCGACGTNCATVFSGATQAFGQCVVGTSAQCVMRCNSGYGNLNGSTLDGCEFQIDATAIYVSVADTTAIDDATCGLGPTGTGTGNHPCKSITQGLMRSSMTGRTQVLVADGTYNEGVLLLNGKQVKGGYRSDTWERHLSTTSTVIAGSTQSGNHDRTVVAASISSPTLFEGFVVRGSFNGKAGGNSYAIYISNSGSNLTIRDNEIFGGRGGTGGAGTPGSNGPAGGNGAGYVASQYDSFQTSGTVGTNSCTSSNNRPAYGGSAQTCGVNNTGGNGGGNNCTPVRSTLTSTSASPATNGLSGGGPLGGAAGTAGTRGYDADLQNHTCLIPVQGNNGLPMFGSDGTPGGSGLSAAGVTGCTAASGAVVGNDWVGGTGSTGQLGGNGGGGGGGGAGGGAHCISCVIAMNQFKAAPDLLGAHGGGGGGGGCGGSGGGGGGAGGGSFGIFIVGTSAPTLTSNSITLGTGGGGGTGGIGGAGGLGGTGNTGGQQGAQDELFCTGKGGRGGDGGDGGAGSGGGGGCGGSTFGIFSSGIGNPNYCASNTTTGGTIGTGGSGGFSGGNSGGAGASGVLQNCVAL